MNVGFMDQARPFLLQIMLGFLWDTVCYNIHIVQIININYLDV